MDRGRIEYVFDGWHGEDFVKTVLDDVYVVSARFRRAMERSKVAGVRYKAILVGRSEIFMETCRDVELPKFYEIVVEDTLNGSGWMVRNGECEECGQAFWTPTKASVKWVTGSTSGGPLPPRRVFEKDWQGQDVFRLSEPGPIVVTERVKAIFDELAVAKVQLEPAVWDSH